MRLSDSKLVSSPTCFETNASGLLGVVIGAWCVLPELPITIR